MKVAFLTLVLAILAAQTAPQNNIGNSTPTATIQGRVTRSDSSAGISDVQITVSNSVVVVARPQGTPATPPPPAPAPTNVVTDASGHFAIQNLAPGSYQVRAQRDGYFGPNVNGTAPAVVIKTVTIDPIKKDAEANFVLIQGGVISGRVRDPNGQPISGVTVAAQRLSYINGRANISTISTKITDDRGEYRIFWLSPGEYYVGMIPRSPSPIPGPQDSWLRTFFPGVSDLASASAVIVKDGGLETAGTDFSIRSTSASDTFKISGRVINSIARPNPTTGVLDRSVGSFYLAPREPGVLDGISAPTVANALAVNARANGEFEIRNVRPGSYDLFPLYMDNVNRRYYTSRTPIDVRNGDIQDLSITLNAGISLAGQVLVNGSAPARPESIRINLRPLDDLPTTFISIIGAIPLDTSGSFTVADVPEARYAFQVTGLPDTAYIETIRQGSRNVFDDGITIDHGAQSDVQINVNTSGAMVEGNVTNMEQKPAANATVVLIPAPARRQNTALYKFGSTDEMGHFSLRGVAPGDYKLFAWESIPSTAWQNSDYLAKHESRGRPLRVESGTRSSTVLTVIPDKP